MWESLKELGIIFGISMLLLLLVQMESGKSRLEKVVGFLGFTTLVRLPILWVALLMVSVTLFWIVRGALSLIGFKPFDSIDSDLLVLVLPIGLAAAIAGFVAVSAFLDRRNLR